MQIGVISDTHFPNKIDYLSKKVFSAFKNVQLILHAGDIHSPEVLKQLSNVAPVVAVAGNGDPASLANQLGYHRVVYIEGLKIGIAHGHHGSVCESGIARSFAWFDNVDLVIGGHTHIPEFKETEHGWYLNPGSIGVPKVDKGPSVAILSIEKESFDAKIIYLNEIE
ncbi:MAG: metallophosphoesterase family protein [Clostridia bacterium]